MTSADYRIESNHPLACRLFPMGGLREYLVADLSLIHISEPTRPY